METRFHERIESWHDLDELAESPAEQLAEQLAEVDAEREELAVAERVLRRQYEQEAEAAAGRGPVVSPGR
ncbi:hypothetical protein [Streptomyces sp. NPDC059894]|uniref:hypothetical protein n=1 Tax=unclassified Streptomyces TaxID=2593676 RepID=UPI00365522C3